MKNSLALLLSFLASSAFGGSLKITSVSPLWIAQNAPVELTIGGEGFDTKTEIELNGTKCSITARANSEIKCTAESTSDAELTVVAKSTSETVTFESKIKTFAPLKAVAVHSTIPNGHDETFTVSGGVGPYVMTSEKCTVYTWGGSFYCNLIGDAIPAIKVTDSIGNKAFVVVSVKERLDVLNQTCHDIALGLDGKTLWLSSDGYCELKIKGGIGKIKLMDRVSGAEVPISVDGRFGVPHVSGQIGLYLQDEFNKVPVDLGSDGGTYVIYDDFAQGNIFQGSRDYRYLIGSRGGMPYVTEIYMSDDGSVRVRRINNNLTMGRSGVVKFKQLSRFGMKIESVFRNHENTYIFGEFEDYTKNIFHPKGKLTTRYFLASFDDDGAADRAFGKDGFKILLKDDFLDSEYKLLIQDGTLRSILIETDREEFSLENDHLPFTKVFAFDVDSSSEISGRVVFNKHIFKKAIRSCSGKKPLPYPKRLYQFAPLYAQGEEGCYGSDACLYFFLEGRHVNPIYEYEFGYKAGDVKMTVKNGHDCQ